MKSIQKHNGCLNLLLNSPRLYRDRLWLLNSGTGDFGYVDVQTETLEPIALCPGYARGLAFIGKFAVIGLSQSRESMFKGLALDARLAERHAAARCGLIIVNLETGDIIDWVRIEGALSEHYDVVTLPGIIRPRALGFQTPERDTIDFGLTATVGLSLNLGTAATQVVHGTNLSLNLGSASTFENVIGGSGNDILTGNALGNDLNGNSGNDTLALNQAYSEWEKVE